MEQRGRGGARLRLGEPWMCGGWRKRGARAHNRAAGSMIGRLRHYGRFREIRAVAYLAQGQCYAGERQKCTQVGGREARLGPESGGLVRRPVAQDHRGIRGPQTAQTKSAAVQELE